MYSTFEVHVIKHAADAEVMDDLTLEAARAVAHETHGVVVERVHYELDPAA